MVCFCLFGTKNTLETQFAEEPLVLAGLVFLLELHTGLETVGLPLDGVLQILDGDLLERDVRNAVAGRHQVVVVQDLNNTTKYNLLVCFF